MRISFLMVCAILTARTTVCSSSLGMLRTLVGAMRPYAITKLRCASSRQVVFIMQEETSLQKLLDGMCNQQALVTRSEASLG
jgi:hypothetical protein